MRIAWLGGLLAAAALPALAQDVIIYRCTDAAGGLAIQNLPCPKGTRQQMKRIAAPQAAPAYLPPAAVAAAPAPAPAPSPPAAAAPPVPDAAAPRLPPPALFECTTRDNDRYLSEDEQAATRCLPLRTTGLDGNPQGGAGQACEVVSDRCARVPDGAACDAWSRRLREAESHWRFALPEHAEQRRQEYERLRRIVEESSCGAP